ncbi:MAG: hypothetical protein QOG64_2279 [Acidimicrobiaceae bacterium]|nr:hypothetical protein [Acidimicrobiaceae bacterium]
MTRGEHRRRISSRRFPAIVVLAALLVAAGVADRDHGGQVRASAAPVLAGAMPTAAPPTSLNSSWYCPGATSAPGGPANGSITILNTGDRPLTAKVTVVPVTGDAKTLSVPVPAKARTLVHEIDILTAPVAAALVDLDGGAAAVELTVNGPGGWDSTPCASAASDRWYFATGTTDRDATLLVTLFNPFPGDAIVDLSFATDQGPSVPGEFQGLIVPAGRLTVVNVGDHVRRRADVATTVVARAGRVVAGKIQTQAPPAVATVAALGAPSDGASWVFPDGFADAGVTEQYHLYNPNNRDATATLSAVLDQGEADPLPLTVPPQATVVVVTNDQNRIPKGVGHSATVRSTNGVGIVVERTLAAGKPSPRLGLGDVLGARRAAPRWALPVGAAAAGIDEVIVLFNPGTRPATAAVTAFGQSQGPGIEGLQALSVPAGGRLAIQLDDHITGDPLPVLIDASEPVVVERALYFVGAGGVILTMGIPIG